MIVSPRPYRLLLPGLLAFAVIGCGKQESGPKQMPPPEVGVITAKLQSVPLIRDAVGRLSAFRSADVRARVSGVLLKRSYEEGSEVKQGQVLFEIDPAPLKATLGSAQAALAQAQANYTNNHVAAQRAHELAPKGYVSKADLDNADAAERSSRAAVAAARAQVESARINLGYATVRAPIDGRAGKQQVTEGALVGQDSATLLTTVDQIDPMYVNFSLAAADLNRLRQAQARGDATLSAQGQSTVRLRLPAGNMYKPAGKVDFSGTVVDPSTGAVTLRASLPNPDHLLLPGMYADLKVNLGNLNKVVVVPQAAVQRDARGAFVLIVGEGNLVARRNVQTGEMQGGNWIITSGLATGDRVIVSGLPKTHEGKPVKPTAFKPDQADTQPSARKPTDAPRQPGAKSVPASQQPGVKPAPPAAKK